MFFFYFNLIFEYKLVILIYFFFVNDEIKLTYLLTYLLAYLLTELSSRCNDREQCSQDRLKKKLSYCCIYCTDMLRTYQRRTKLFEFSRDTSRREFNVRKNDLTCQWLYFAMIQPHFVMAV